MSEQSDNEKMHDDFIDKTAYEVTDKVKQMHYKGARLIIEQLFESGDIFAMLVKTEEGDGTMYDYKPYLHRVLTEQKIEMLESLCVMLFADATREKGVGGDSHDQFYSLGLDERDDFKEWFPNYFKDSVPDDEQSRLNYGNSIGTRTQVCPSCGEEVLGYCSKCEIKTRE